MSRTYKDAPAWTRPHDRNVEAWVNHTCHITGDCNLYVDLGVGRREGRARRWRDCTISYYRNSGRSVPRWFRDATWESPENGRVRRALDDARHDWNTYGDTDVIVSTDPHRRRSAWWWD